jgi:hypothetical protein
MQSDYLTSKLLDAINAVKVVLCELSLKSQVIQDDLAILSKIFL